MNKLGVHANVWAAGWTHEEAERAITTSAKIGYDLIEIPILDPASIDVPFTLKLLEKHGLGVTCSMGLDGSCDVSSEDAATRKRGQAKLEEAVSVVRDLGATHACGILYSAFQKYSVPPTAKGIAYAIEVIQKVAEKASAGGIMLGMEVVNRYETNILNTASQGVAFCKRVGMDNVKVHLDVYHMNIE